MQRLVRVRSSIILCLLLLTVGARLGYAQTQSQFTTADIPEVMPADKLIVGPTEVRIALGSSEVLRLNTTVPAGAFVSRAFKLRIFRVDDHGMLPGRWASFQVGSNDWCDVFLSNVFPYLRGATVKDSLSLPSFTDPSWLTLIGSSLERGQYLVIFERSDDAEPLLRLRRSNVERYFATALRLEIVPVGLYSEAEIKAVRDHIATSRARFELAAHENSPKLRCYRVQQAKATSQLQDESLALVGDCEGGASSDAALGMPAF